MCSSGDEGGTRMCCRRRVRFATVIVRRLMGPLWPRSFALLLCCMHLLREGSATPRCRDLWPPRISPVFFLSPCRAADDVLPRSCCALSCRIEREVGGSEYVANLYHALCIVHHLLVSLAASQLATQPFCPLRTTHHTASL